MEYIKNNSFEIMLYVFGAVFAVVTSLYLSSVLYFLLNGWDAGQVTPFSIFSFANLTVAPYGMYLAISFIAPNLIIAAMALMFIFKPEDNSSRWATSTDMKKAGMLKTDSGLVLGKYKGKLVRNDEQTHAFVLAPTGSGKGVGLVIPNLLLWNGSVICLDVKGENHQLTSGYRAKYGHKIINFCPFAKNQQSHCYNPLDYVSKDPNKRITDLQIIATILVETAEKKDPHFPEEAQDLFVGLTVHAFEIFFYEII